MRTLTPRVTFPNMQVCKGINPTGRVNIQPKAALLPPAALPGGSAGLVRGRLSLSVWEPAPRPEPGVATVWFNEPYHLLGDPVLTDARGEIYLLPPQVPAKGGQALRSRDAHPVTTIFTKENRSFWKPVSQERWILALIERAKAEIRTFLDGLQAACSGRLNYCRFIALLLRVIFLSFECT